MESKPVNVSRVARAVVSGSPLYLLSALCVLYGIARILAPFYEEELVLPGEKFACLGAISVYEVAVLVAALVIVLARNVLDDAVALVVVASLFLVAAAATLDVVAAEAPMTFLIVGSVGLALAATKVFVMSRFLIGRLGRSMVLALVMLGFWNFLQPGILARAMEVHVEIEGLIFGWACGWWWMIASGVVLTVGLAAIPAGELRAVEPPPPLLRSRMLRWILALLIWWASALHGYGQTWAFNLHVPLGDMLSAIVVGCMALVALRRAITAEYRWIDAILATVPMALTVVVIYNRDFDSTDFGAIGYPPALMLVAAIAWLALAWHIRSRSLLVVSWGYLLFSALTFGSNADTSAGQIVLNWHAAGAMIAGMLLMLTIFWRDELLAYLTLAACAGAIVFTPSIAAWMEHFHLEMMPVVWMAFGVGIQVIHQFYRNDRTRVLAAIGSIALAIAAAYTFQNPGGESHLPLTSGLVLAAIGGGTYLLSRDRAVSFPLFVPLFIGLYQAAPSTGWSWILAGFLLLGAGMVVSLVRGNPRRAAVLGRE